MADICKTVFTPQTSPVGMEVTKRFPWWRTAYQKVTDNDGILNKFVFRAPQGNQQAFANDKPWPVYIDEVRFWVMMEPSGTWLWNYHQIMDQTCFRISTDLQSEIVSVWLPGTTYHTEPDRHFYGYQQNMMFTLPGLYYLPYGSQFAMDLQLDTNLLGESIDVNVQAAIRGCDPYNENPNVILSRVTTLADPTGTPAPGKTPVAFDDNRDRPVKSMWIRDFTITNLTDPYYNLYQGTWESIQAKFHPPEGPEWTSDEVTPLIALADQVSVGVSPYYDTVVIHRPPTPYILRPGDSMKIEAQVRYEPDAAYFQDHRLWAHVRGWQLGEGI